MSAGRSTEDLERALWKAREALRLTREYVGEGMLPAVEGWSWYDAILEADRVLDVEPLAGVGDIVRAVPADRPRNGHRVRVAMKGWNMSEPARTADEVSAGVMLPWIEIDGARYDCVTHAEFHADAEDFDRTLVTVGVLGSIEIVYLGPDGEELVSEPAGDLRGERFDREAMRLREVAPES